MQPTSAMTEANEPDLGALRSLVMALLVFILAVAVYAPAIEGPFVWDDETLILREEVVTLQSLPFYFSRPFWLATDTQVGASYYRPITILTLALDHALHGENPAGFHLTNLFLHGLNAAMVLALGRRLGAQLPSALAGALLFAWFPRLSEAAAWISGRTDLLAASFSLAALLVLLGKSRGRTWLSAFLLLLGVLGKEVAIAAALAAVWYEWRQSSSEGSLRARLFRLLPLLLAGLAYASLRLRVLGTVPAPGNVTVTERLIASFEALGRYAFMLMDGWHPSLNIGYLGAPDFRYATLGAATLVALSFAFFRRRPQPKEALLLTVSGIGIALVLHLLPYQSSVSAADRFLYLPIAAAAPVLAGWISRTRAAWTLGLALTLALSYLPSTWQRARIWGDDILFWGTAVHEQDGRVNALSHAGLASVLAEQGMYEEAMTVYGRIRPDDRGGYLAAVQRHASLLAMNGETERALGVLERAHQVQPSPRLSEALALSYAVAGKNEQARLAVRDFEGRVEDEGKVAQLRAQVATLEQTQAPLAGGASRTTSEANATSLEERLARGRFMGESRRFRLAMTEFMAAVDDPRVTNQELRGIVVFSLEYGTPRQVRHAYERLLTVEPALPAEFSLLVAEHESRVQRLRKLCRELGVPVLD